MLSSGKVIPRVHYRQNSQGAAFLSPTPKNVSLCQERLHRANDSIDSCCDSCCLVCSYMPWRTLGKKGLYRRPRKEDDSICCVILHVTRAFAGFSVYEREFLFCFVSPHRERHVPK